MKESYGYTPEDHPAVVLGGRCTPTQSQRLNRNQAIFRHPRFPVGAHPSGFSGKVVDYKVD